MNQIPDSAAADQNAEPDLIGDHEEQDGEVHGGRRFGIPGRQEELEVDGELQRENGVVEEGVPAAAAVGHHAPRVAHALGGGGVLVAHVRRDASAGCGPPAAPQYPTDVRSVRSRRGASCSGSPKHLISSSKKPRRAREYRIYILQSVPRAP